MMRWRGLSAVVEGLKGHRELRKRALAKAMPKIGRAALKELREGMPPSGAHSPFDGYASKGRLRSSFGVRNPKIVGNRVSMSIGQKPGTSKRLQMIARVHETGATIEPRTTDGYLVFKVQGQWVRTKRVRIRAKHYFRDGWRRVQDKFPEWAEKYIREDMPK